MPDQPNFPIPSVINPPDTRCIQLQIPDNDDWIRVFVGLLAQPTYWFNWQRDTEKNGKELAQVWSKLFDKIDWGIMSCCCDNPPAIFRYNEDNVYQMSTDGGVTWVDASQFDYRNISTVFPPPSSLGFDNTKCQNADSAVVILNEDVIQGLDNGSAVQAIIEFIAAVLIFYLSAGTLATVAIGLFSMAAAIIGYGVAATKAAFTSTVLDQLRCSLYCVMNGVDSIDEEGLEKLLIDINSNYTGIVKTSLYSIISASGVVGITNMLRSNRGASDADCSACDCGDCPVEWTFYGAHDIVRDGNDYTMVTDGGGAHLAWTSGDMSLGCYCDLHGYLPAVSWWPLGSGSPVGGTNPKVTSTWNADFGGFSGNETFHITFSSHPI